MSSTNKYYDLTKTFRFESAHRLAKGYVGKCGNIHGHSWNGSLTVRCLKLDEHGMGIDFGTIKQEVLNEIEDIFDHKLILFKEDPLVETLKEFGAGVVTMQDNPTSEVIAEFIFDYATKKLNREVPPEAYVTSNVNRPKDYYFEVVEVIIDETCTSSCKVTKR